MFFFVTADHAGSSFSFCSPRRSQIMLDCFVSILIELRLHQVRAGIDKSSDNINRKIQHA
jgi:hypothetical protein